MCLNSKEQHALKILYQDNYLLAVEKPSGLLAVPGRGVDKQDCLSRRVQQVYASAQIVHRLDRDTSGLMLMALDPETHRELSRMFAARQIEKQYLASVYGEISGEQGAICLPLRKDLENPPCHRVDHRQGKPAETHWQVVRREPDRTWLLLRPITGRSHQLRVHLQAIGHPILGDNLYAHSSAHGMAERLMLHASRLEFAHPVTAEQIVITSDGFCAL